MRWGCLMLSCIPNVVDSHDIRLRSSEPVKISRSSGEKAAQETSLRCPRSTERHSTKLPATLQTRAVLSLEADTKRVPSPEKLTQWTQPLCPRRVKGQACRCTLHSLTVWSEEAVAMDEASGDSATDITDRSWPNKDLHHSPVLASHVATDPSAQAVTTQSREDNTMVTSDGTSSESCSSAPATAKNRRLWPASMPT